MGRKYDLLINNLVEAAKKNGGIALLEVWDCQKCQLECYRVHPMEEVLVCPGCGHHYASKLPRYQMMNDAVLEAEYARPAITGPTPDNY